MLERGNSGYQNQTAPDTVGGGNSSRFPKVPALMAGTQKCFNQLNPKKKERRGTVTEYEARAIPNRWGDRRKTNNVGRKLAKILSWKPKRSNLKKMEWTKTHQIKGRQEGLLLLWPFIFHKTALGLKKKEKR